MVDYINVVIGGHAIISDNYCIRKGIANGTSCLFANGILNKHAVTKLRRLPNTTLFVPSVISSQVECIIMKHTLRKYKHLNIDGKLHLVHFVIHHVR